MTQQVPSIQQRILEAWLNGTASLQELAERFTISKADVRQILRPFRRNESARRRLPIKTDTLSISRGIFNVLPTELTASFTEQLEEAAGGNIGLILVPTF